MSEVRLFEVQSAVKRTLFVPLKDHFRIFEVRGKTQTVMLSTYGHLQCMVTVHQVLHPGQPQPWFGLACPRPDEKD